MMWPEYPLAQITERFISGGTPSTNISDYWKGHIPWITGADILNGEVTLGRRYINESAVNNSTTNIVPKGSLLMVTRTGVGKIALAPIDIAISQDFTGIVLKEVIVPKYVLVAIRSKIPCLLAVQRGATIKGVTRADVENITIPLPSMSEQLRIVEILDQADALRKKRAKADAKAARILPALFNKMFGDPLNNQMDLPTKTIGDLLMLLRNGTTADQNHDGRGYPVTRIETISDGVINPARIRFVEIEDDEIEKWKMEPGDILFSHINSESHIGKTAIYKSNPKILIHGMNLLLMRPNQKIVLPEYLFALLNMESVRTAYRYRCKRAVNQASLNQKDISALSVATASIESQTRFCRMANFLLDQIEKQKEAAGQIDSLFDNLMHQAFTGDLTAKWREAHMKELLAEMKAQAKALETTEHTNDTKGKTK